MAEENNNVSVDQKDIDDNKIMGILAYIFFLIPLLAAKESPFARFHTNQAFLLFITAIAYVIAIWIITIILALISPILLLIGTLLYLASIVFFVLAIIGIINAAKGEMKELPIIGKYRIIK